MPSLARPAVARALTDAGEDEEDHEGVEHRHDGQRQGREDLAKGPSGLTAGDVRERVGWRQGIEKNATRRWEPTKGRVGGGGRGRKEDGREGGGRGEREEEERGRKEKG